MTKILIVEDKKDIAELLRNYLQEAGCITKEAGSPEGKLPPLSKTCYLMMVPVFSL